MSDLKMSGSILEDDAELERYLSMDLDRVIFLGYRGSHVHGYSQSDSDVDLLGVTLFPPSYYIGLTSAKATKNFEIHTPDGTSLDFVIYELRHFIHLLLKGNPNVLLTLFLPDKFIRIQTHYWREIVEQRDVFLSKQAARAYLGYARSHMEKFHRKKPPKGCSYDGKAACSAIRVLEEGIELFRYHRLTYPRPDAHMLTKIRTCQMPVDMVVQTMDAKLQEFEDAVRDSRLPQEPDLRRADLLVQKFLYRYLKNYWTNAGLMPI